MNSPPPPAQFTKAELRLLAFFAALPRERKKLLLRVMKPMAKKRKA